MRYIFVFIALAIFLAGAQPVFCVWDEMIQVNTTATGKQASRDSDCPWPIAADDSGNVYTVWEDKQTGYLEIYFRKRNYDGTWNSQENISNEWNGHHILYGHPSICVLPGNYPPWLLTCYVREYDGVLPRELRGNTFNGELWGDPSYYISDENSIPNYTMPFGSWGWGTNIVALSDGRAYAFWQYIVGSNLKLYFNEYNGGWTSDNEKVIYNDGGAPAHYSRHENASVDGDDNIHLVYIDNYSGNDEIYYLSKSPQDNDFGDYPGTQVSLSSANTSSVLPYCAVSEIGDTTFLHVVWSSSPTDLIYYRNWNSVTDSWSAITDTIAPQVLLRTSEKPSVACDSYGNVHVVWGELSESGSIDIVKYRKLDYATGEWGPITTLPANTTTIDAYGLPVIISDVYDNLHVLMTGRRVGAGETDEEIYYSFFDAPPLPAKNLQIAPLWTCCDEYPAFSWDPSTEPNVTGYNVYRSLLGDTVFMDYTTICYYVDESVLVDPRGRNVVSYYVKAVDALSQLSVPSDNIDFTTNSQGRLYAGDLTELIGLQNNFPNPFNPSTTIKYNLTKASHVKIEIYDILGRRIETLVNERQLPGQHTIVWNADNIASGMYFYRIKAGNLLKTKRMTLLK